MADQKSLPNVQFENLYSEDHFGQRFWKGLFGEKIFTKYQSQFIEMGRSGALATAYSETAERVPPELIQFNKVGERVDQINYHPDHEKLEQLSFGKGIVSKKYQSPLIDKDKAFRHQIGFSTGYYFAQTETGIYCPICMTDALGSVFEKHSEASCSRQILQALAQEKLEDQWQGAMFLTEIQGGSDVGANVLRSENQGGEWRIYGEKWFCSNVDADAALVLARLPGEEGRLENGTKGLGLFLLLRSDPKENFKNWQVNRLKNKLGVRSMASGEVSFNGARVHLLGGFGKGFKMMAEMVNMSRLYNSVSSLAIARRSLLEARAFANEREAFGRKLTELPLWRSSYSDLSSEFVLLKALVFTVIQELDKGECGDEEAMKVSRLLTPVCKALAGKFSVFCAAESMELIGGNGYIEDHILPRLLRDAQVLPIWEGTTHIQSLDLLRSFKKEGVEPLFKRLARALVGGEKLEGFDEIKVLQKDLQAKLQNFSKETVENQQRVSREVLEQMGRVVCLSFVFEMGKNTPELCQATLKRQLHRKSFFTAPSSQFLNDSAANESTFLRFF